jgi:hypothetical protein
MNIYKIEHSKEEEAKAKHKLFSEYDRIKVMTVADNTIELLEEPCISIRIYKADQIQILIDIMEKYNMTYTLNDVTSEYINNTINFNNFLDQYPDQKDDIKLFMISCMTIDDVLDKINEFGIESLNEVDKVVLKQI